jgi:two-component system CheB/CheR fusion protein
MARTPPHGRARAARRNRAAGAASGSSGASGSNGVDASSPDAPAAVAAPGDSSHVPIVGVGASAGGLEAFSQLLSALPPDLGMAIVLIQHLAPQHESALTALLAGVTALPVVQAEEGMQVEVDVVYVIPPNVQMGITAGVLHLNPRPADRTQYNAIDFFFRCMADAARERAVAVVLSGTASDGAAGIRDVKAAGGTTFAQLPETAKFDGMPRAAIATGMVDLVLSPAEIAAEIAHLSALAFVHPLRNSRAPPAHEETSFASEADLARIFAMLRAATGVDFRQYKRPTILRRLQRRMALHKTTRADRYLRHLEETPGELQRLYRDFLIHVTRFFREPASFEALAAVVSSQLLRNRRDEAPIRIWVCGCATGEEAYSVAIVLLEELGEGVAAPVQIFATDLSEAAIDSARNGFYPDSIAADVSPERLRRFFTRADGGYRVAKQVRDLCVFARQDLASDPPFSKLDLVLCRNVLMYMDAALQRKLIGLFHYALKPGGYLMLGNAETAGSGGDLFAVADKKHRVYVKRSDEPASAPSRSERVAAAPTRAALDPPRMRDEGRSILNEANRVVLDRYVPPGVVVDADLRVVQFRGQTGRYLQPAPGDPSLSLLPMAREGLLAGLRAAFSTARKRSTPVRREGLRVRSNGGWHEIDLEIVPLQVGDRPHYLVVFEEKAERRAKPPDARRKPSVRAQRASEAEVAELHQELAASREHLSSIISELEGTNEALQSANEEILSSNEELQSTNEELDTAKEELQSTNEELNTVNDELHSRNDELSRVNSDLVNLLGSVEIAIVIVATDMRIRRFTPMAERLLNLIPGDVGRPIGHIQPNVDCPNLEALIAEAAGGGVANERDVKDRSGHWYSLRVRPYENIAGRIDGAVLTLFDVDASRRHEAGVRTARDFARAVHDTVRHPLIVVDEKLRVHSVNPAFSETFGVSAGEAEGRDVFALASRGFDLGAVRAQVEPLLQSGTVFDDVVIDHEFPGIGRRRLRLDGRRFERIGEGGSFTLLAMEDLTAPAGG